MLRITRLKVILTCNDRANSTGITLICQILFLLWVEDYGKKGDLNSYLYRINITYGNWYGGYFWAIIEQFSVSLPNSVEEVV